MEEYLQGSPVAKEVGARLKARDLRNPESANLLIYRALPSWHITHRLRIGRGYAVVDAGVQAQMECGSVRPFNEA